MWDEEAANWKATGNTPTKVERVDTQGNLWFFDLSYSRIGKYNLETGSIDNIQIQTSEMESGIDIMSFKDLTFRDGYIFAICNLGLYVWNGDENSGFFNAV